MKIRIIFTLIFLMGLTTLHAQFQIVYDSPVFDSAGRTRGLPYYQDTAYFVQLGGRRSTGEFIRIVFFTPDNKVTFSEEYDNSDTSFKGVYTVYGVARTQRYIYIHYTYNPESWANLNHNTMHLARYDLNTKNWEKVYGMSRDGGPEGFRMGVVGDKVYSCYAGEDFLAEFDESTGQIQDVWKGEGKLPLWVQEDRIFFLKDYQGEPALWMHVNGQDQLINTQVGKLNLNHNLRMISPDYLFVSHFVQGQEKPNIGLLLGLNGSLEASGSQTEYRGQQAALHRGTLFMNDFPSNGPYNKLVIEKRVRIQGQPKTIKVGSQVFDTLAPMFTLNNELYLMENSGWSKSWRIWKYDSTTTSSRKINSLSNSLSVYPNPNSGKFTLENKMQQPVALAVINMQGLLIRELELDALERKQVELQGLSPGVYLIRDINTQASQRIMIR